MTETFKNRFRIKSARCDSWDYGWNAEYFVTICTLHRIQNLGKIIDHNMILSESGKIIEKCWHSIPDHFDFVQLGEFVVMPDHIHGILKIIKPPNDWDYDDTADVETRQCDVETRQCLVSTTGPLDPVKQNPQSIGSKRFRNPGKQNISSVIGSFKSICAKMIRKQYPEINFAWQSRFHDHIIRDEDESGRIQNYIMNNPKNWKGPFSGEGKSKFGTGLK